MGWEERGVIEPRVGASQSENLWSISAESQRIVATRPLCRLQHRVPSKSSARDLPQWAVGIVMSGADPAGYASGRGRAAPIVSRVTLIGNVTPRLA